jgi:hypothetical protein
MRADRIEGKIKMEGDVIARQYRNNAGVEYRRKWRGRVRREKIQLCQIGQRRQIGFRPTPMLIRINRMLRDRWKGDQRAAREALNLDYSG